MMPKKLRVVWTSEEIDSLTDAALAKYGLEGWEADVIKRIDSIQNEILPLDRRRWCKSKDALVKIIPIINLKLKQRKEAAQQQQKKEEEAAALKPLPVGYGSDLFPSSQQSEASWEWEPEKAAQAGTDEGYIEELPPLEEKRRDDALRELVVEKVSDFLSDILAVTFRKFLTNADIAHALQHLSQYGRPDVVVEATGKHTIHDPQPAPKLLQPTILICGFKPHQWPPFQQHEIARKARLRFWHSDHGQRTLQSKLQSSDAAFFLMESAGHDQVQMAQRARVKVFKMSGGYEPAFRAIEGYLKSLKEQQT